MGDHHILISGDYWHAEFKDVLTGTEAPVTMVPIEKLTSFLSDNAQDSGKKTFDLIVLGQARRNEIDHDLLEQLQAQSVGIPIVMLLGSWCEGETRSGDTHPGLIRIYWHQWNGRYQDFLSQLRNQKVPNWNLPSTANHVDRLLHRKPLSPGRSQLIGVSAWAQDHYEMLKDAITSLGYQTRWIERATWDAKATNLLTAVCMDVNSLTDDVVNRVRWIQSNFDSPPMILILNFPRADEADLAKEIGVATILSKPFELPDLKSAIEKALGAVTHKPTNAAIE